MCVLVGLAYTLREFDSPKRHEARVKGLILPFSPDASPTQPLSESVPPERG
jgi:hypothetical protein